MKSSRIVLLLIVVVVAVVILGRCGLGYGVSAKITRRDTHHEWYSAEEMKTPQSNACAWLSEDIINSGGVSSSINQLCQKYLDKCGHSSVASNIVNIYETTDPQSSGNPGNTTARMEQAFKKSLQEGCRPDIRCNSSPDPSKHIPCPKFLSCQSGACR